METVLSHLKSQKIVQNFADVPLHMFNLFFTLTQKFEFLPTTFAVVLTPVALLIVPRVEFNFEVIMYIAIFVS